jgi:hypothetical protein
MFLTGRLVRRFADGGTIYADDEHVDHRWRDDAFGMYADSGNVGACGAEGSIDASSQWDDERSEWFGDCDVDLHAVVGCVTKQRERIDHALGRKSQFEFT